MLVQSFVNRFSPTTIARFLATVLLFFAPALSQRSVIAAEPQGVESKTPARPNIILIMSDDMGFSDLGCYGGEIETPNLDSLAANGVRFTQFYNTARCCPTRASLLTGLYPHQAGVGHMMEDKGEQFPGYRGELNRSCRTIAEVLQPAGYRNYAVGKWHVTPHIRPGQPQDNWPLQRGFDRYYGIVSGASSLFDPHSLARDNRIISAFDDPEYKPETYYFTHAITDHAVRFIDEHSQENGDQPFFMYVAYTAAHWPMHALPDDIAKYKGRYSEGYEAIRKARLQKAAKLGLVDPAQGLSESPEDWDKVKDYAFEEACMEVYAAMVDSMDQGIGKIMQSLERNDRKSNTLVFFLQDNGGCAEPFGRRVIKGGPPKRADQPTLKPMTNEEFQFAMAPPQTREGYPVRQGYGVIPGPSDTYIGYGRGWATVSNTPFREYKHWVHEGGISTPLIAHWPAQIQPAQIKPAQIQSSGELRTQPGHLIDIMATCADVAGAAYPSDATPLEGVSLVPAFENQPLDREAIYWEHEGNRAVRVGDWKAVAKGFQGAWELYDISKDRIERNNLADQFPEKLEELASLWNAYAERCNVFPSIWDPKNTR
jgi:arylsulfatase A-like enzyme